MLNQDELELWNLMRDSVEDGLINTHECFRQLGISIEQGYSLLNMLSDEYDLIDWGIGERWVWLTEKGKRWEND